MLILQVDGLNAVVRVVVVADHQGIVCNHQVFRIVQHWLHAEEPEPFYDTLSNYVILPTILEFEKYIAKHGVC
jgi:phospholipase A1